MQRRVGKAGAPRGFADGPAGAARLGEESAGVSRGKARTAVGGRLHPAKDRVLDSTAEEGV